MFDIGALELLMVVVVAIIVIGPKDMPQALRVAGRWMGKIRRASAQFRSGFDAMVREAEMEDMEKQWKDQNARIMAETPDTEMQPLSQDSSSDDNAAAKAEEAALADQNADRDDTDAETAPGSEPMLPLDKPGAR